MSGLFEHLDMFDEQASAANRQAIAVANKRFNDHFGTFLRQASTKKEFESRLALVDTDIANMISDVANEYGGDPVKIAKAIKQTYNGVYKTALVHSATCNCDGKCEGECSCGGCDSCKCKSDQTSNKEANIRQAAPADLLGGPFGGSLLGGQPQNTAPAAPTKPQGPLPGLGQPTTGPLPGLGQPTTPQGPTTTPQGVFLPPSAPQNDKPESQPKTNDGSSYWSDFNADQGAYGVGDSGKEVEAIQKHLINTGYMTPDTVDGNFGQNTEAALRKFQEDKGLTADGTFGTQTLRAFQGQEGEKAAPEVSPGQFTVNSNVNPKTSDSSGQTNEVNPATGERIPSFFELYKALPKENADVYDLNDLGNDAGKFVDRATQPGQDLAGGFTNALSDSIENTGDMFSEQFGDYGRNLDSIMEGNFGDIIPNSKDTWGDLGRSFKDNASEVAGDLSEGVSNAFDHGLENAQDFFGAGADVRDKLVDGIGSLFSAVDPLTGKDYEKAADSVEGMSNVLNEFKGPSDGDLLDRGTQPIQDLAGGFGKGVSDAMENAGEIGSEYWSDVKRNTNDLLEGNFGDVLPNFQETGADLGRGFLNNAEEVAGDYGEGISNAVDSGLQNAKDVVQGIGNLFSNTANDHTSMNIFQVPEMIGGASDVLKALGEAAGPVLDSGITKNVLNNLNPTIGDLVEQIGGAMPGGKTTLGIDDVKSLYEADPESALSLLSHIANRRQAEAFSPGRFMDKYQAPEQSDQGGIPDFPGELPGNQGKMYTLEGPGWQEIDPETNWPVTPEIPLSEDPAYQQSIDMANGIAPNTEGGRHDSQGEDRRDFGDLVVDGFNEIGNAVGDFFGGGAQTTLEGPRMNSFSSTSPETGDSTEKRESLPKGDEYAQGGPSPKMDKKKWIPNATNPEGNLKPIKTEGENSPHPTRQVDVTESADYKNNDPFKHDNNVWSREELKGTDGDAGFNTDRNISQDGQSGTFPKKNLANPVTKQVFAAWYSENSLFRSWLKDHGIELSDNPVELLESPVVRELWKQFVQDVPSPGEDEEVIGRPAPDAEGKELPVEDEIENDTIDEIIEREDKEGDRVNVIDVDEEDDMGEEKNFSDEELEELISEVEEDPDEYR